MDKESRKVDEMLRMAKKTTAMRPLSMASITPPLGVKYGHVLVRLRHWKGFDSTLAALADSRERRKITPQMKAAIQAMLTAPLPCIGHCNLQPTPAGWIQDAQPQYDAAQKGSRGDRFGPSPNVAPWSSWKSHWWGYDHHLPQWKGLAMGGIVPHRPGGHHQFNVGEGGESEAIIPLSKLPDLMSRMMGGGNGGRPQITIMGDVYGWDDWVDKVGEANIEIEERGG